MCVQCFHDDELSHVHADGGGGGGDRWGFVCSWVRQRLRPADADGLGHDEALDVVTQRAGHSLRRVVRLYPLAAPPISTRQYPTENERGRACNRGCAR